MPLARALLATLLVALPAALAASPVVLVDPAGDQDTNLLIVAAITGSQAAGSLLEPHDDVCDDPRADMVAITATATSARIHLEVEVADPDAAVSCGGALRPALSSMARFPHFRIALQPVAGGRSIAAYSVHLGDGAFEQCIRAADLEACSPQDPRAMDFPTLLQSSTGETIDLRGSSFRLSATAIDSFGRDDPKTNLLIFEDHVPFTDGGILSVPSAG